MNPKLLLTHFNRLSEAPDAIPRLRSFILDLAVRGKLLEQKLSTERVDDSYLKEPMSEQLPRNWRLLNFGKFCDIQGGNQPPKNLFVAAPRPRYVRLFQIRDLGKNPVPTYIPVTETNRFCREGEILIGRYGASVGKVFWAQNGAYNVALAKFIFPGGAFLPQFAFLVLKSSFLQATLIAATRSAQAGFNKGDLAGINLPLPPIVEQHRIVAKMDELMALCDQLETVRTECDGRQDRLAAATHHHLSNATNAEASRAYAHFYLKHLPRLSTRVAHIQQLRETVLNLAVRGRLVPQDNRDEPASDLLKRIQLEMARSTKTTKQRNSLQVIGSKEGPFEIPPTWLWVSLDQIAFGFRYGTSVKCSYENAGEPVLRIPNIVKGSIKVEDLKFGPLTKREADELRLRLGDILMVRSNGSLNLVGRAALVEANAIGYCFAGYLVRVRTSPVRLDARYLTCALNSSFVRDQIEKPIRTTVGLKNVNASELGRLMISLPPLDEQHRIVAKIAELMVLCDELEAQLSNARSESRRLLDAVVHHALTGTLESTPRTDALTSGPELLPSRVHLYQ